jgi:hypothetical protein
LKDVCSSAGLDEQRGRMAAIKSKSKIVCFLMFFSLKGLQLKLMPQLLQLMKSREWIFSQQLP